MLALKGKRSVSEYCWTAKSFALGYLIDRRPELEWAVYVDADMLAFGDLDLALLTAGNADFLLTPHRFAEGFESFASAAGAYNAGYVAFRNSSSGRAALTQWTTLCTHSCPAVATADAYADQKYLERLPAAFPAGIESEFPGLNAGPWNIGQYELAAGPSGVMLSGSPLLLYHFQSLRVFSGHWIDLYFGGVRLPQTVRKLIYEPYLEALARSYRRLRGVAAVKGLGMAPLPRQIWFWLAYSKRVILGQSNLYRYPLLT